MSNEDLSSHGYATTRSNYSMHNNNHSVSAALLALPVGMAGSQPPPAKLKRLCRFPGCTKVIKSQGHCQRHGARAKRCRVDGCDKQAQGTHDGMCKRHWKAMNFPEAPAPEPEPLEPVGESAYDSLLPKSIAYRPSAIPEGENKVTVMPLVQVLREGAETKEPGWHRHEERLARGLPPVTSITNQLEAWEKQLALVEILLLSGGTPYANFRDLAHAWGRERGFHHVLISTICSRRGEVERKRRSDATGPPGKRPRSDQSSEEDEDETGKPDHIYLTSSHGEVMGREEM